MQHEFNIYVKGMVCDRCILAIRSSLHSLGLVTTNVSLGEVTVLSDSNVLDIAAIQSAFKLLGFEILEDKATKIVREIKSLVQLVYSGSYDFPDNFRFSSLAKDQLHRDYDSISSAFSVIEGITIEKYIIHYRIEKVKEYLMYSNESLFDIAFRLGFSSTAHLSAQFKSITGKNTSYYKELKKQKEVLAN